MNSTLLTSVFGVAIAAAIGIVVNWFVKPQWATDHPGRLLGLLVALVVLAAAAPTLSASLDQEGAARYSGLAQIRNGYGFDLDLVPPGVDVSPSKEEYDVTLSDGLSDAPNAFEVDMHGLDIGRPLDATEPDREGCRAAIVPSNGINYYYSIRHINSFCIKTNQGRIAFLRFEDFSGDEGDVDSPANYWTVQVTVWN